MLVGSGGTQSMMDADFRNYLRAAQGPEPDISLRDPRWHETERVARKLIETSAAEPGLKSLMNEPLRKKRWDLLLLTGHLHLALGQRPAAIECFEIVADKCVAADDRDAVIHLLPRFLDPEPVTHAVRFLHYLAKGAPGEEERIEFLRHAIAIRPGDPDLHLDLAAALERADDAEAAREHRLRYLELSLEEPRPKGLSGAVARTVEEDLPQEPGRAGSIVLKFASKVDWSEAEAVLELAMPELEQRAGGLLAWDDLAALVPKIPANAGGRETAAELLKIVVAREPQPEAIVDGSRIADPGVDAKAIVARVPKILALPPGAYVSHAAWGLGRVASADGESVTLDFPGRQGHQMSFAMASKSLLRLPGDGLRVLAIEEPERFRELAKNGDPDLLARALREVGGQGKAATLKARFDAAFPEGNWAAYFKKAKEKAKEDPRFDFSEAYHNIYALAEEGRGAKGAVLPRLSPRAAAQGLLVVKKFLREHPEEEPRLRDHAGDLVARWVFAEGLDLTGRAQALCYAVQWKSISREDAVAAIGALIGEGLAPDDLNVSEYQEMMMDLAEGSPDEETLLWRAFESRLPRLRDRGRLRLQDILGDGYARAIEHRIQRSGDTPSLTSRLIEHFAASPDDAGAPPPASLLVATIRLLEKDLPEGTPERLLALLDEDGIFRKRFAAAPPDPESAEAIERTVTAWGGSERRLVPVLEFLRAIGHAGIADAYEERRKARAKSLLEGKTTDDVETRFTLMTRTTYQRLEAELKRLALELKTTIPAAIERARQLGDLRENAEYEAAKLKQANAAHRVQELITLLEQTRILETLEIDPSRVGAGTEVTLTPIGGDGASAPIRFWILGEGDHQLGEGILSYRAPIARPLLGKSAGAEVEIEFESGTRKFRVETIRRRLPGDPVTA
jgi:transcription elongation factor GreA